MYADFAIREGNLPLAYENAHNALEIASAAGPTSPWVSAALYYLGDVRIRQGGLKEAMYVPPTNDACD